MKQVLEKSCRRNMESCTQFLYVGFVDVTFLVQDFRYDTFRAENWDQVFLAKAIGVHQCAEHLLSLAKSVAVTMLQQPSLASAGVLARDSYCSATRAMGRECH